MRRFAIHPRRLPVILRRLMTMLAMGLVLAPAAIAQQRQPQADEEPVIDVDTIEDMFVPLVSADYVLAWAERYALDLWQFEPDSLQEHVNAMRPMFTITGWRNYIEAISLGGIVDAATSGVDFVIRTEALRQPILDSHGQFKSGQAYTWVVDIPVKVSYEAGAQTREQAVIMSLVVQRVPVARRPDGLIISAFAVGRPAQQADQRRQR